MLDVANKCAWVWFMIFIRISDILLALKQIRKLSFECRWPVPKLARVTSLVNWFSKLFLLIQKVPARLMDLCVNWMFFSVLIAGSFRSTQRCVVELKIIDKLFIFFNAVFSLKLTVLHILNCCYLHPRDLRMSYPHNYPYWIATFHWGKFRYWKFT